MTDTIFTIGHSTHPVDNFIEMLKSFDIEALVDIRTIPKSRYNPQFSQDLLAPSLASENIEYYYMKDLGGLRHAKEDSPNQGWRNSSFRGYADYMQTQDFQDALQKLIELGRKRRIAIMCAEAVPWRCHRSLVADALTVRHIPVEHIMAIEKSSLHKITKFAHVEGKTILYPPETAHEQGSLELI